MDLTHDDIVRAASVLTQSRNWKKDPVRWNSAPFKEELRALLDHDEHVSNLIRTTWEQDPNQSAQSYIDLWDSHIDEYIQVVLEIESPNIAFFPGRDLFYPPSVLPTEKDSDREDIPVGIPGNHGISSAKWGRHQVDQLWDLVDEALEGDYDDEVNPDICSKLESLFLSDPIPNVNCDPSRAVSKMINEPYDNFVSKVLADADGSKKVLFLGAGSGHAEIRRIAKKGVDSVCRHKFFLHDPIVEVDPHCGRLERGTLNVTVLPSSPITCYEYYDYIFANHSLHYIMSDNDEFDKLCRGCAFGTRLFAHIPDEGSLGEIPFIFRDAECERVEPLVRLLQRSLYGDPMMTIVGTRVVTEPGYTPIDVEKKFSKKGWNCKVGDYYQLDDGSLGRVPEGSGYMVVCAEKVPSPIRRKFDFSKGNDVFVSNTTYTSVPIPPLEYTPQYLCDAPRPVQEKDLGKLRYGEPYYFAEKSDGITGYVSCSHDGMVVYTSKKNYYFHGIFPLAFQGQVECVGNFLILVSVFGIEGHGVSWGTGMSALMAYIECYPMLSLKRWQRLFTLSDIPPAWEGIIITKYSNPPPPLVSTLAVPPKTRLEKTFTGTLYVKKDPTIDVRMDDAPTIKYILEKYEMILKPSASIAPTAVGEFFVGPHKKGGQFRIRADKTASNSNRFIDQTFMGVTLKFFVAFWKKDRELWEYSLAPRQNHTMVVPPQHIVWPLPLPEKYRTQKNLVDRYIGTMRYVLGPRKVACPYVTPQQRKILPLE